MHLRASLLLLAVTGAAWAASPAQAVAAAQADARALARAGMDPHDLEANRYFRVREMPRKERERLRAAFRLGINLVSRYAEMIDVAEVRPDLWRLDLDLLQGDRATLEAARFVDPYFHLQVRAGKDAQVENLWPGGVDTAPGETKGKFFKRGKSLVGVKAGETVPAAAPWLPAKEIDGLRRLLYTEVPVLDAEWFLSQTARQLSLANEQTGLGYYDWLQLRDRRDYFRLVRFNEDDSVAVGKDFQAIQELSGVSPAPRVISSYQATSGIAFVTLDTNLPRGRGIPLKDVRKGAFKHQIEEWYAPLPNGLPATFLSDDRGNRQNNAPADAAGFGDTSAMNRSRDARIHVNLACIRCHGGLVIRPVEDYVRHTFKDSRALGTPDRREQLRLQRQYFSDLDRRIKRAREDYQEAFRLATVTPAYPKGMDAQTASEAYAGAYHAYADDPVTPARAAQELGVRGADLQKALALAWMASKLDTRLAPFVADPALPLSRQTWEDAYPLAAEIMSGFLPKR